VRGELRVVTHDPASETLFSVEVVHVGGDRFEVAAARPTRGAVLLSLAGVGDRTAAEALRGKPVAVDREAVPVEEGEVLLADLVGCRAVLPDGTAWGEIVAVETGPQDRLVVASGAIERLLPAVDAFLLEVDLEGRVVVVDPPEGLPEDERR
jgi:16S rRNA processing protein RimM